jgi:hypothetical protein
MEIKAGDILYKLTDIFHLGFAERFRVSFYRVNRVSSSNVWLTRADIPPEKSHEEMFSLSKIQRDGYQLTREKAVDLYRSRKKDKIFQLTETIRLLQDDLLDLDKWLNVL